MTTKTLTSVLESNPAKGEIRGLREINRRKMKAPRPAMTSVNAYRVRLWYADIERARATKVKKGGVGKAVDRYLRVVKGLPTVQAGGWCDVRDKVMAKWLKCSRHTVMRHREQAVAAKLLEDKGTGGRDHKPCLVRPIMSDGSPVFMVNSATPTVAVMGHEQASLLELPEDSSPPTPSEPLPNPKKECGPSLVARDAVVGSCGPAQDTSPGIPTERPRVTAGKGPSNEKVGARAADIATHSEAWEATDKFGGNHAAFAAEWKRAPYEATAKITAWIRRGGRLPTGNQYPANWLKHGLWENLGTPKAVPDQIGFRVELGALGAQLRRRIDPAQFRAWFVVGEAQLVSKTDDTVTLAVKNAFFANRIASDFAKAIAEASGVPGLKIVVREDGQ